MGKSAGDLQGQLSEFWSNRPTSRSPGTMEIRTEQEHQAWLDALRPLLPAAPAQVLDVGTGQGFLALLLADLGHRVIGVDTAEGMLVAARTHAAGSTNPPEFRPGDAMDPPLAPSSLDVVTNRQVVWTLLDPARAFRNWLTLLKPGGRVLSVHLRQNNFDTGGKYPEAVKAVLPALRLEPNGEALVTRFDRNYADAVANLARETGFIDVNLVSLEQVDRFEAELGTERRWLALTGIKP
jgi:SAM-dependent methyltransferase